MLLTWDLMGPREHPIRIKAKVQIYPSIWVTLAFQQSVFEKKKIRRTVQGRMQKNQNNLTHGFLKLLNSVCVGAFNIKSIQKKGKTYNFYPILTIYYSILNKLSMGNSKMPSKPTFSHF